MRKYSVILLVLILGGGLFAKALENPFKGEAGVFDEDIEVERKPSKWTAAGLSLLLPGAGELYLGDSKSARLFLSAEGVIWAAYTGFTISGNWQKEQYHNYAAIHAGVRPEGKDDQFFEDVLRYPSRDSYNYWMHLVYRDQIPLYPETKNYFWAWESDEAQKKYGDIRASSERAYRSARTALGVALINRIISVVHVLRMDTQPSVDEASQSPGITPRAFVAPAPNGELGIGIALVKEF